MDLLISLLNLNKIESNLIIIKSNMSFNNNISFNLYNNNNSNHIKNQYIIDHHHHHNNNNNNNKNTSNIQIIHKIERRSNLKQSPQQQQQQQITNYYEPEEILSPDYTLPYQDIKCMEFIQSTEIKYIKDSSMLNGFFGMSNLPKRTIEYSFQTPNYPAPYPLNIECIKVIAAPTDQHRIVLHFRGTFELEPESHCTTDFLEIRDGAFGFTTLLGRFCSKQVPDLGTGLISTGQYMWLRFHSDSTIAHRGFQAVYRFIQTGSHKPTDSVSHVQFQINLQPGQAWKLDQQYVLMKMEKLPSKIQQLPLEVALDIRSTNGTYIMLHIDHVQVPQSAAWSCQPESTFTKLTRVKCLTGEPIVFGLEKKIHGNDITDSGLNKLSLQDPSSIIDGQHTFFEVYPGKTISQFVPPCPKIIRFCDKTVGILKLPKNHGSDRDFYIRYPRLIIRMVIASPNLKPDLLETIKTRRDLTYTNINNNDYYYHKNSSNNSSLEENNMKYSSITLHHHNHHNYRRRHLRQTGNIMDKIDEKLQEYMPKFVFVLTSLKQKSVNGKPCVKDWEACDSEVCIPKHLWCDDVINCPQWQDEGGHCTRSSLHPNVLGPDGQLIQDTSKSVFELRKEQEQLEAEAERLAAQKLHLSILATLGLILLIVTSTCIFMTIRRRRRETARQIIKSKEDEQNIQSSKFDDRRLQRLNHVMSTSALLEGSNHLKKDYINNNNNYKKKPIFTLSNSSLTQDIQYSNNATNNTNYNNNNQSIMMHELKSMKKSGSRNTTMIWNSTDSINAPLLWQRNVENMKSSSSPGQMNSNKNLIKYSLIKTKGNHNNISVKLSNKKINPIKQTSAEKETIECVQFQSFNNNATNINKSSIVSVNNSMNESTSLPNTTINSIRTMTNILRDKSTQPTSLTHTYGSYPITSFEQTDVYERNKHNLNTFVQKRMIEQQQQQQQQQQQFKRSGNKTESHSLMSSPQNRGNWIATNIYPKIDKELPILTNTHLSQTDHDFKQRISNLNNTINRTQSWGAGLRYNNNVHIYCEQDNRSPLMYKIQNLRNFKPSQLSSIPKCQLYSVSNSQEHLHRIKRSDTYVSMPDVNGLHNNELLNNQLTNYHHTKQIIPITSTTLTCGVGLINIVTCSTTCTGQLITSSKDYRPPQAKRPRIINSLISSNVISNNDNNNNNNNNNVVGNVNKLSRHATPIHNENNFNNTLASHLTTTTTTITITNTTSSNSSDKSSISSNPYSGSEHSHVLLNPNYQHLHHQHHHSQSPHHHHHHHHQILYPSVGIQNVLLTDDKLYNRRIYGLNDFQQNMLMYGSNTSTVDNIRTNIERYKYHKENNDDDEEGDDDEENEGSNEERGDCGKTKKSGRTNLIVATDHVDDNDNEVETTLSRTDSKNSLELLKGEDETDIENSERYSPENSPVNNSTSISETDTSQNACSTHEEPIKITVYQSEPYKHRTISHSSLSPTKSISPHSSPKHQQQYHHHHRHHHHHQYKPKYVTDRDKSSHLQIRSDDQNISETSSDLIYEYEA
ncbi:unnamed protein product [Schistosoma spindalis]|nr:unnamed protein product [Schistosoma spindale]